MRELRKTSAYFRDRVCLGVYPGLPIRVIGVSIREGGMLGSPCALGGFGACRGQARGSQRRSIPPPLTPPPVGRLSPAACAGSDGKPGSSGLTAVLVFCLDSVRVRVAWGLFGGCGPF